MALLDNISTSSDLKKLSIKELSILAEELREKILQTITNNGGHLSANLGVVELTLAIHYVFDLPNDKLIFDVGHQCYVHKLLSNRSDKFDTIRTGGGLSGFPDKDESEFDPFTTGHAGNSIASALGLCAARDALNEDYTVINVVGDASIVNGLNLEAMSANNNKPKKLVVILNDNGMSISKNVNGLYKYIAASTTKKGYEKSKRALRKFLGRHLSKVVISIRNFIKRVFSKTTFFELFGFKYIGVVDGNDIKQTIKFLQKIKNSSGRAVLLHVNTTKGKGHDESEEHADEYHGVGKNLSHGTNGNACVLGKELNAHIEKDNRITVITAGMKTGTGLSIVEKEHPQNFVDVGIAEEYAVTLAAGMATGGLKPVVAIYSTFMQRAYDQIVHDVCMQNLPVVFCLDRAGFVGEDGKTHQGLFDLSYLSHIPNMHVLAPNNEEEVKDALDYALSLNCPVAIRYPKSNGVSQEDCTALIKDEPWVTLKDGDRATIIAVGGKMKELALSVANDVDGVKVVSARVVKPLCERVLDGISSPLIITLEENVITGGFGSMVASYYAKTNDNKKVICLGAPDKFIAHDSIDSQLKANGLDKENIITLLAQADIN